MNDLAIGDRVTTTYPPHTARGTIKALDRGAVQVDWDSGARKAISPRRPGERILYGHSPESLRKIKPTETDA